MPIVRRSVMTLFSGPEDPQSHRVRIVLAEKAVTVDIIQVHADAPPEDFLEINPYHCVPTLVDRDLVLYEPNVIAEYLDERFPHPPLLPVYPVARAKCRLMMHRIEEDWYNRMRIIQKSDSPKEVDAARTALTNSLLKLAPVFGDMPFFLSNDFTLVDCHIAPLLWRLPLLGIELPVRAKPILDYAKRLFKRSAFQASLTDAEREMRVLS